MDENFLFLQALYQFMKKEQIRCTFDHSLPLDRAFWDQTAEERTADDRKALEAIANCLRRNTSDFLCIEEITFLVESRGFDTSPRHDF